jgi:formylglycine-generating enzyme required for sulfatase activity
MEVNMRTEQVGVVEPSIGSNLPGPQDNSGHILRLIKNGIRPRCPYCNLKLNIENQIGTDGKRFFEYSCKRRDCKFAPGYVEIGGLAWVVALLKGKTVAISLALVSSFTLGVFKDQIVYLTGLKSSDHSSLGFLNNSPEFAIVADSNQVRALKEQVQSIRTPLSKDPEDWADKWVKDIENWLKQADRIRSHIPVHKEMLRQLDDKILMTDSARSTQSELTQMVGEIEQFFDPKQTEYQEVSTILERAKHLRDEMPNIRRRWRDAIEAIEKDPNYNISIKEQAGLMPIGKDPQSNLWEFACLVTGNVPARGPDQQLVLDEDIAVILVLIPRTTVKLGAVYPEDPANSGQPNIDSNAKKNEGPVRSVTLEPYFISKYEMTQSQWMRITGNNPSSFKHGIEREGERFSALHPVENITWYEANSALIRIGLRLPTEDEWEAAARSERESSPKGTIWWTGNDENDLSAAGTLEGLKDGYKFHAPIGKFRPNRFGLYDVIGNVWEWTADEYQSERGNSLTSTTFKVFKGGSFGSTPVDARSAKRAYASPEFRYSLIGLRAAKSI